MDSKESTAPPSDGAAFLYQGKEYFLPRLTQADRKAFKSWCAAMAINAIADMEPLVKAGVMTAERWSGLYLLTQTQAASGHYWWDEQGGATFRRTLDGFINLCLICFRRHDPKVKEEAVRAMAATYPTDPDGKPLQDGKSLLDVQYEVANSDPPTVPRPSGAGGGENATAGSSAATA